MVNIVKRISRSPFSFVYYFLLIGFLYVAHFAELPTIRFAVESLRFMMPVLIVVQYPFVLIIHLIKRAFV